MKSRISRLVFWTLWFVVIPLGLAALTISLLAADTSTLPSGFWGRLRFFIQDQKVPALIIFFTLYEMIIYQLRYSLPFADRLGMAGRVGLPKDRRQEYEHAEQVLDEVARIFKKQESAIREKLPSETLERLEASLQELTEAMNAPQFDRERFDRAYEDALAQSGEHLAPWRRGEVREYGESIFIAIAIALLLRVFLIEAFKIPSGSMLPTLQIQDHIFVNKFAYGPTIPWTDVRLFADLPPKRGDVVVFEYPDPDPRNPRQDYIKRVIALPGDVLEVEGGHPIINGWKVPHCRVGDYTFSSDGGYPESGELFMEFLGEHSYLTFYESHRNDGLQGPYPVQEGEFWVLGDNRNNSSDSRAWRRNLNINEYPQKGAGVPFSHVKGRALFVWLSFNNTGQDFLGVTWDRLLTSVMGQPRLPKEAPDELKQGILTCLSQRPTETYPPTPPSGAPQAKK